MKGYRFIGALAAAFLVSTGFAFSFTRADIDIHGKGGLVGTNGFSHNTGDCWVRPYGFHCSMFVGERATLRFEMRKPGQREPDICYATVNRVGDMITGSRFDVTAKRGTDKRALTCVVHKYNDHDFGIEPVF